MKTNPHQKLFVALLILAQAGACFGQADPASEPAVLALAKVLPAVVNINTERVVRRTVRDPFEDFYAQFFGCAKFARLCKVSAPVVLSIRPATSLPTSTWLSAPQT
jgi:S1-C subfamily serine protease